jgi:polysaccharide export outer membrane protein
MKLHKTLFAVTAAMALGACSTPKHITYFQDLTPGDSSIVIPAPVLVRMRPADKLSINVSCQDERLTKLFNLTISQGQSYGGGSNSADMTKYIVDSEGNIQFPVLGKLHIEGMTREEVAAYIKEQLESQDLVKDPVVTVNYGNQGVIMLGEAGAGRVEIDRDRMTILDVISEAGDLSIQGLRNKVWVYREENGRKHTYQLDLCSAEQVYNSPAYYVQQNDLIYVEPNDMKKRTSTVNGNNFQSVSFWMSLTSFLIGIAALLF